MLSAQGGVVTPHVLDGLEAQVGFSSVLLTHVALLSLK